MNAPTSVNVAPRLLPSLGSLDCTSSPLATGERAGRIPDGTLDCALRGSGDGDRATGGPGDEEGEGGERVGGEGRGDGGGGGDLEGGGEGAGDGS